MRTRRPWLASQGAPIKVRHGGKVYKLGTVCVLDRAPRAHFSVRDKQVWVPIFLSLLYFIF
jgi:hypothetical protein